MAGRLSREEQRTIFVVGNAGQLNTALRVADYLDGAWYLDLWSMRLSRSAPARFPGHTPPVGLRRVTQAVCAPFRAGDVVVLPHDLGMLQRALVATVRRRHAQAMLLPDSAVSSQNMLDPAGNLLRKFANRTLGLLGLLAGTPGRFASSNPDVVLSWGSGWNAALPPEYTGRTVVTGSPKLDLSLPPCSSSNNVLVCSQPLSAGPAWARQYEAEWYSFLETIVESGIPRVRIRLHPRELQEEKVSDLVKAAASTAKTLLEDLEWSTIVAAPFSTVLVEALAAGRTPLLLYPDATFKSEAASFPMMGQIPAIPWVPEALLRPPKPEVAALRKAFCANVGTGAFTVARTIATVDRNSNK